jgi:ABC-type methionine transport system ATPase subunit
VIDLHDVRKVFPARRRSGEVVAVDGVTLRVAAGEFAGVVGPSGSGKSTLVRLVNLLERPTSGSVTVGGRVLTELPDDEVRQARRSIGMVFQHFELLDSRTAAGNVEHPLELAGIGRASEVEAAQVPRSLADVDIAVINGNYAIEADLVPAEDALALEQAEGNPNANLLVVRTGDEDDGRIQQLEGLLHSDQVRQFIEDTYSGAVIPAF